MISDTQIPSGYKQTEIGIIPEDWDFDQIKNLALIKTGKKNTQDRNIEGIYPFFVRSNNIERINSYSYNEEAVLTAGDGVGTGKVFHYVNGKFEVHQRVYKISNFTNIINGYYFYLYFSNNFLDRIMQMTAKSSVDSVRLEMIADMLIPIPSKPEQTAIATALSDTDALIENLDKLIAKKKAIKQGTMQQLLTGKKRLQGFHGEWKMKKLGEVADYRNGKSFENHIVDNGDYNLVTLNSLDIAGKLKQNHLKVNFNDNSLNKNDLVMILSDVAHGNFLGLTDVIPENNKYVLNQRVGALKNIRYVIPYFLSKYININQKYFKIAGQGSSQQNLSKEDIANFEITYPDDQDEQTAITTVLSDIDTEIGYLERKRYKYKLIKIGMMQQLLTGKIRIYAKH